MSAKRRGKRRGKAPSKGAMRRRAKARGVIIADVLRGLREASIAIAEAASRATIRWLNLNGGGR